jgi:hypothetical protein
MRDATEQDVLFSTGFSRRLEVGFDEPSATSDGGAPLLKAIDESLGLTRRLARSIMDVRCAGKVQHPVETLARQRIFGIACGYVDGNDAGRMSGDPMHRLLCEAEERGLASQPTLSRFENHVSRTDLFRMGRELASTVIEARQRRHRKVRRIVLDFDGTVDPTHGAQQHSLFHGFYDTWCYFPLLCFATFDDEPEQRLIAALLRRGTAREVEGALGILRRLVFQLRSAFPKAQILVRLDAGFTGVELFDLLDDLGVDYVVAMAENAVLECRSARLMRSARHRSKQTESSVRFFGETMYAARSWHERERRVIFKAEVLVPGDKPAKDNARYVVTSLSNPSPKEIYELYCQRGDAENRIKELKSDLEIDRTSCTSFTANQLRVLLTAAAYALYQELRCRITQRHEARLQVGTLRLQLIKIGGRLVTSARRYSLHLAQSHPWRELWQSVARRLGAITLPALC